jgi:hypothetical protein
MGHPASRFSFHIVSSKEEATRMLEEAERLDFYQEECLDDYANALARKNSVYAPNEVTVDDQIALQAIVENAKDKIPLRLQQDITEVHFIQLMPSAEGGMPHTRPMSIICYPDRSRLLSVSTLIHELWHLHQRLYATEWTALFLRLGWVPWKGTLPYTIESYRRINPDTIDQPLWCFQKTWVPVPVFRDISRPVVSEVDIWFYHVVLQYRVKAIPEEIRRVFPDLPPSAYEHPREWSAYLLSDPTAYADSEVLRGLVEGLGVISLPRV